MTRPYFAKYLPVKGEIKEEDEVLVRDLQSTPVTVATIVNNSVWFQETPGEYSLTACILVKLFLCSKDIQVGDKVHSDGIEGIYIGIPDKYAYIKLEDDTTTSRKPESLFKVIGEISPDALRYVEEGDEFEEDEVALMAAIESPYGTQYVPWIEERRALSYGCVARIKGPCGHFH